MSEPIDIVLVQLRDGRHRARVTGTVGGVQRVHVRDGWDRADVVREAVIDWYRLHTPKPRRRCLACEVRR